MCLAAVKQNGFNLQYATEQTHEICFEAVSNKPFAIKYVLNQTPEICLIAYNLNPKIIYHIKDKQLVKQIKDQLVIP